MLREDGALCVGFGHSLPSRQPLPPRTGLSELSAGSDSTRTRPAPGDTGTSGTACRLCLSQGKSRKQAEKTNPGSLWEPRWHQQNFPRKSVALRDKASPRGPTLSPHPLLLSGHPGDQSLLMAGIMELPMRFYGVEKGRCPRAGCGAHRGKPRSRSRPRQPRCPSGAGFSWPPPGRNVSRCRAKVEAGIAGIATG